MNKIKNYLCNADPFDIMLIIIILAVFLGIGIYVGPLQVILMIGVTMIGVGIVILFGFLLYFAIEKLQQRCKNVQS